jgi:hypothetical protein
LTQQFAIPDGQFLLVRQQGKRFRGFSGLDGLLELAGGGTGGAQGPHEQGLPAVGNRAQRRDVLKSRNFPLEQILIRHSLKPSEAMKQMTGSQFRAVSEFEFQAKGRSASCPNSQRFRHIQRLRIDPAERDALRINKILTSQLKGAGEELICLVTCPVLPARLGSKATPLSRLTPAAR